MYKFQKSLTSVTARGDMARLVIMLSPTVKEAESLDKIFTKASFSFIDMMYVLKYVQKRQNVEDSGLPHDIFKFSEGISI